MKKVYHINVKVGKINFDLFFDTEETAEKFVSVLTASLTAEGKNLLQITATIEEVLDEISLLSQLTRMLKQMKS